jgi:Tol biopolymer transport system component
VGEVRDRERAVRVFPFVLALAAALAACSARPPLGGEPPVPSTGFERPPENPGAGGAGAVSGSAGSTAGVAGAVAGSGGSIAGAAGASSGTAGAAGTEPPSSAPTPEQPPSAAVACSAALTSDSHARTIAFDSDRDDFRRQLFLVNTDGSGLTRLLNDTSVDKEPSFSPDGRQLSFTSDRAGASQIFVLDLATRVVRQLTSRPEGADESSFAHDGARVAYHSGPSVYVIGADGTGEKLVATGDGDFNAFFWPHFSLDDTELVFDRNNEIDAAGIETPSMRMIVQNTTTTIKAPAVSPDGNDVAYDAECYMDTVHFSIWTTPFSSNTEVCAGRRVTTTEQTFDSQRPAWGTTAVLAYERVDTASNLGSIALISRAIGSAPCVIVTGGGDNRNPAWSP